MKSQWFVVKQLKNSKSRLSLFQRTSPQGHNHETVNSFLTLDKTNDSNHKIRFNSKEFNLPESIAGVRGSHCHGILFLQTRTQTRFYYATRLLGNSRFFRVHVLDPTLKHTGGLASAMMPLRTFTTSSEFCISIVPMLVLPLELRYVLWVVIMMILEGKLR